MNTYDIDILLIQETHSSGNTREKIKWYTWYFSGGPDNELCYHGVGIVLNNQLIKHVKDVKTISARLITLTLHGKVDIHVTSAYAPTAIAPTQDKDEFYKELTAAIKSKSKRGAVFIGGDMNAKFREEDIDIANGIGPHIFGKDQKLQEGEGVEDNRNRLTELLTTTKTMLTNTYYYKQPQYQITYNIDKAAATEPPFNKNRFDTIDYIIVPRRWKNSVKDTATNLYTGVDSDHYPLTAKIVLKLKAEYKKTPTRTKYQSCTIEEQLAYNHTLAGTQPANPDNEQIAQWIRSAAETNMRTKEITRRPFELSDETEAKMEEQRQQIKSGKTDEELKQIRKEVSKSVRKDRRQHQAKLIDKELDVRDQYMGLKYLRNDYVPVPLGMKDAAGRHVPFAQRADKLAECLHTQIRGKNSTSTTTHREPKIQKNSHCRFRNLNN